MSEQTSLTGNSVSIYVENKTTLKGAVIASTSNDLTLDTGSFEYIHIKDKDISYNAGAGVNLGSNSTGKPEEKNNTWSVNASYGFSQKRQTNFATIGEGTIIVRDGETDLSGLNRDITKAQYGTVDIGLKGGFTVDSSTVAFVTSPIKTITETYAALEKGYEDAAKTTEEIYEKSVVLYEKTTNLISEGHFVTDSGLIVVLDKEASEKYWSDVNILKGKYQTLGEGYIKNNLFTYIIDDDGNAFLIPRELDCQGSRIAVIGGSKLILSSGIDNDYVSSYDKAHALRVQNYGIYDDAWVNSWKGTAILVTIPAVITSPVWVPKVGSVVAYEGVKSVIVEATVMGNVNGMVQVGSNMLVKNDYSFKGNATAYGAGFVTGVATSMTGNVGSPVFTNITTGFVAGLGDYGTQAAMNIQSGKQWDNNISVGKAVFSGVMNTVGMNITAPYLGGTNKLTLPEKTAVDTMFLVPTVVGTEALFDKRK